MSHKVQNPWRVKRSAHLSQSSRALFLMRRTAAVATAKHLHFHYGHTYCTLLQPFWSFHQNYIYIYNYLDSALSLTWFVARQLGTGTNEEWFVTWHNLPRLGSASLNKNICKPESWEWVAAPIDQATMNMAKCHTNTKSFTPWLLWPCFSGWRLHKVKILYGSPAAKGAQQSSGKAQEQASQINCI